MRLLPRRCRPRRTAGRAALAAAALAAGALVAPGGAARAQAPSATPAPPAEAAPPPARFRPCPTPSASPVACTRVAVPLLRGTPGAGRVRLAVARAAALDRRGAAVPGRRATRRHGREAVLYLTGGPGQGASALVEDLADESRALMRRRDLLAIDVRGTGSSSDLVVCPEVQSDPGLAVSPPRAAACATRFGAAAGAYGTAATVADVEAVRRATGYDRLLVVGVSYGTYVAQRYALAHPDRVSGLVLDSALPAGPVEPFARSSATAVPRTTGEVCRLGGCRGVTRSPRADLAATQARLPIVAAAGTPAGGRGRTVVDGPALLAVALSGDLDPITRATVPAALRSAGAGDPALLARLARDTGAVPGREPEPDGAEIAASAAELNLATFVATTCRDVDAPWEATTPLGEPRLQRARAAAAALGPERPGGFDADALLRLGPLPACARWPTGPDRTPAGAPRADLPVLVLSGTADTRTPLEDARAVAAAWPRGVLVAVPGEGHSVLGGRTRCVRRAVAAFVAGRRPPPCRSVVGPRRALPVPPRSAARLGRSPAARAHAVARLAAEDAARATVAVLLQSIVLGRDEDQLAETLVGLRIPGLRGGAVRFRADGAHLERYAYVGGTRVDGRLRTGARTAVLRVRVDGGGSRRVRIASPLATVERLERSLTTAIGLRRGHRLRVAARAVLRR